MTTKERILEGLTGRISALELGSSEGSPLIGIHGWLDNAATFIPLSQCLESYRWLCLDMPGHGNSDPRPRGSTYHFTDYVGDLFRAMNSLGLDRCDLIGHSLGAGIVATFAATFPEKVNRLILIDGLGPISGEDDDSLEQLRKSMSHLAQPSREGPRKYPSWQGLVEKRLQAGAIQRHSVEMLLSRGARREGDSVTVVSDGRLKQHSPIYMNQQKVISLLAGIEARTLLVLAEDGLVGSRESTKQRMDAIKNLTTVTVPGAHHLHLDDPEPVAAEIRKFMQMDG